MRFWLQGWFFIWVLIQLNGEPTGEMNCLPPKYDFEWSVSSKWTECPTIHIFVKWLPCGIEKTRVFGEDTNIALRFKSLESKQWSEASVVAAMPNKTEAVIECVFPGRVYEVIITSIGTDGNSQADDPKEVYYPPFSSRVRCVKIKQLTNDTAMIFWQAPSQSHQPVYGYRIFITERNKYQNNMFSIYDSPNFEGFIKEFNPNSFKRKILHLKTGVEYMFTIFPITKEYRYGFEYSFPYILHPLTSKVNLPLAKPYIWISTEIERNNCKIYINWIHCVEENDCKNTQPALLFNYQVKNQRTGQFVRKLQNIELPGDFISDANTIDTYEVTVQAVVGNVTLDADTKNISCREK